MTQSSNSLHMVLPERVSLIPEDRIGTPSGNPSSSALYGFRKDPVDKIPTFAIARLEVMSVDERTLNVAGQMLESMYEEIHDRVSKDASSWADIMQDYKDEFRQISAPVRYQETSDLVLSTLVAVAFDSEILKNRTRG